MIKKTTLNYALYNVLIYSTILYVIHIHNGQTTINYKNINNYQISSIDTLPTFCSKNNISLIYNTTGKLTCKLITKHIEYSDNIKTTYVIQPIAILFNKKNIPAWNIKAKQAKITHNKIMYLCGDVQINNLIHNSYLQCITANIAILNLVTHDIFSNEMVTIRSISFKTIATNIRGNLYTNIIELSKRVYTIYETKNQQKTL